MRLAAQVLAGVTGATVAVAQRYGTEAEAKAMLEKAVAALKADKAKALASFASGEGGFKDRDLYPFCANTGTGEMTAHPTLMGKRMQDIVDKNGKKVGDEMQDVAGEGKISEVSYMWPLYVAAPWQRCARAEGQLRHEGRRSGLRPRLFQIG